MSPQFLSGAGLIGLATGLLGALSALVMLLWPPQVAEQLVSYPFTTSASTSLRPGSSSTTSDSF
jgi:hypothetical protein